MANNLDNPAINRHTILHNFHSTPKVPLNSDNQLNQSNVIETMIPKFGFIHAGHFQSPYGYQTYRSRGTQDCLMTFTISGQGKYERNGQTFSCTAGDMMLLTPSTPHLYYTASNETWEFYWVHFTPSVEWQLLLDFPECAKGLHQWTVDSHAIHQRIVSAFHRLLIDSVSPYDMNLRLSMNAVEEILLQLRISVGLSQKPALDPRIEEVLHLLNHQFKEPHSVEGLARHVSLSPSRLAHLFKSQIGDSLLHYLLILRLRHAARLLEFSERQITEIAEDVGFHDSFYFSKQFRAFYNLSPSQYRKQRSQINLPKIDTVLE
jgi:AraC family transcriptional regulator of arabinose operon